jgi:sec-independent protein translocase protein TatB
MFDIGFSELLIVAVVALVVLGPERLPKAARFAGLWVRRARAQWYSVKAELERDLAADELRKSLHDTQEAMRGFEDSVRKTGSDVERGLGGMRDGVRDAVRGTAAGAGTQAAAGSGADVSTDATANDAALGPPMTGPSRRRHDALDAYETDETDTRDGAADQGERDASR